MKQTKAAIRYAKSFLSFAKENGSLESTREDMELVRATIQESRDLRVLLKSPIIKSDKKLKVFQEIFAGKIGEGTSKFLAIIISKGREVLIPEISDQFIRMFKENDNVFDAEVTSANALTDEQRDEIRVLAKKIQSGKIEISETIDESLIGGFILRIGDQMIDTSIKKQLRNLRQEFAN